MRAVMQGRVQMRDVKVKTKDLLEKVRSNREKHIKEYEEAVAGYKEAAKDAIEKAMQRLKRQIDELEEGEVIHLSHVSFNLAVPENHEKDYDQAIAMLEMCVDEEITIKSDEFACYVMDDWEWKAAFTDVSNVYKNRR